MRRMHIVTCLLLLVAILSFRQTADTLAADDPTPDDKAKKEREEKIAEAEAAQKIAEAKAAALKAKLGVPDSGFQGEVTLSDKAGTAEAALLGAKALNTAAKKIVESVKSEKSGASILLYPTLDFPKFQALLSVNAQIAFLKKLFEEADKADKVALPGTETVPPETAGLALDAINKLFGFFRTDYNVKGIDITVDDSMLVNAVAGLLSKSRTVQLPSQYIPKALSDPGLGIFKKLTELATLKAKATQKIVLHEKEAERLTKEAENKKDQDKENTLKNAELHKKAANGFKDAITFYDEFFKKLTTADDKGLSPLADLIREDSIYETLSKGEGSLLLMVKIHNFSGSQYTAKNLWSFFGAMPFYNMGGIVVSYVLLDGKHGNVMTSGVIPVHGGFFKPNDLKKEINK